MTNTILSSIESSSKGNQRFFIYFIHITFVFFFNINFLDTNVNLLQNKILDESAEKKQSVYVSILYMDICLWAYVLINFCTNQLFFYKSWDIYLEFLFRIF